MKADQSSRQGKALPSHARTLPPPPPPPPPRPFSPSLKKDEEEHIHARSHTHTHIHTHTHTRARAPSRRLTNVLRKKAEKRKGSILFSQKESKKILRELRGSVWKFVATKKKSSYTYLPSVHTYLPSVHANFSKYPPWASMQRAMRWNQLFHTSDHVSLSILSIAFVKARIASGGLLNGSPQLFLDVWE